MHTRRQGHRVRRWQVSCRVRSRTAPLRPPRRGFGSNGTGRPGSARIRASDEVDDRGASIVGPAIEPDASSSAVHRARARSNPRTHVVPRGCRADWRGTNRVLPQALGPPGRSAARPPQDGRSTSQSSTWCSCGIQPLDPRAAHVGIGEREQPRNQQQGGHPPRPTRWAAGRGARPPPPGEAGFAVRVIQPTVSNEGASGRRPPLCRPRAVGGANPETGPGYAHGNPDGSGRVGAQPDRGMAQRDSTRRSGAGSAPATGKGARGFGGGPVVRVGPGQAVGELVGPARFHEQLQPAASSSSTTAADRAAGFGSCQS